MRGEACSRLFGIWSGLLIARAEMVSATSKRQSLSTAVEMPDLLTAFIEAVATLVAMLGDQSRGKRWWVK